MSNHDNKLKTRSTVEAEADADELEAQDNYNPEPAMAARHDFDSAMYGKVVTQLVLWSDARFTEMSVFVYRLIPKGMCMEAYVPVLIGSYPYTNTKH